MKAHKAGCDALGSDFELSLFSPVILEMNPQLDLTVGAVEIGTLLSAVLYGVMNMQAYTYYTTDTRSSPFVRVVATLVW
jgi:hypothetical protein